MDPPSSVTKNTIFIGPPLMKISGSAHVNKPALLNTPVSESQVLSSRQLLVSLLPKHPMHDISFQKMCFVWAWGHFRRNVADSQTTPPRHFVENYICQKCPHAQNTFFFAIKQTLVLGVVPNGKNYLFFLNAWLKIPNLRKFSNQAYNCNHNLIKHVLL